MCQALLISKRTLFLNSVRNESINSVNYRERVQKNKQIDSSHYMDQQIKVDLLLSDYEEVAAQAVDNGIDLTTQVFSFMNLLRFDKIWMKVWGRSYNSGFFIVLPSVEL